MRHSLFSRFGAPAVLVALGAVACESTAPSVVPVELNLLASPPPAADIASATLWVSRGYLKPGSDSGGGGSVVLFDTPQQFDLLALASGVGTLLGTATVPTGTYNQLRLVIDSASITLGGGVTFADGNATHTLFVPSGMQTGVKVGFSGGLALSAPTTITVEFDVLDNFVLQGPSTGPKSASFTPTLKATVTTP